MGTTGKSVGGGEQERSSRSKQLNNPEPFDGNNGRFRKYAVNLIMYDTGMSESEANDAYDALVEYAGGDFSEFRKGNRKDLIKKIDSIISRMPTYEGDIWRGLNFGEDAYDETGAHYKKTRADIKKFENYRVGDIHTEDGTLSSWSSMQENAAKFAKLNFNSDTDTGDSVLLICKNNKSGVGIQHISKFKDAESEVLVPSTTRWQVVSKRTVTKEDYHIEYYQQMINKNPTSRQARWWKEGIADIRDDIKKKKEKGKRFEKLTIIELKEI